MRLLWIAPTGLCEMELTMKQTLTLSTLLLSGGGHTAAAQSAEQGASWYRIVQMYEEPQQDNWRAQAILYA